MMLSLYQEGQQHHKSNRFGRATRRAIDKTKLDTKYYPADVQIQDLVTY